MKLPPTPTTRIPGADHGFTLIELLMTIVVAGILLGIAMPAFRSFVLNDRDIGQINSLVSSLNYARSEAVKVASPTGITVCPSTDGQTCSGGTAWAGGWVVVDTNNADCGGAACPPLQSVPALVGSNTVTPVGATTGITFSSSGLVAGPPGTTLTIRVCDTRGAAFARDVEVNATGRVAASQTPGQSVTGAALVCP
ncbi:MAG TPA: GspH/FimT family pseudopilin [Steroidobacteraceae bacterium]|jgi:type IV fimbrial biogenesis protein FimT|nr:GspH/FimT family pseudopilin [Steroidobacteraceae bacterium]